MSALGWSSLMVGLLGLFSVFRLAACNRDFGTRSSPATAPVLPYEERLDANADGYPVTIYHLVLRMELDSDRRFATVGDTGTSWKLYPEGAVVRVRYDPRNPESFRLDAGSGPDVRARTVVLFSVTCILIAVLFGQHTREGDEIISIPAHNRAGPSPN